MGIWYTVEDLEKAIINTGVKKGDTISLQVSLGRLGLIKNYPSNFNDISNVVIDCFLRIIGNEGTLLVPTYTYSFGKGEEFNTETTPSAIGEFPEIFRKREGVIRSRDPMVSNAAIGPLSKYLTLEISNSSFGLDSTFHRLHKCGGKICTLGISLYWATFIHYIEEMANVPFRFHKKFSGKITEKNKTSTELWDYFAAPLSVENCESDTLKIEKIAKSKNLVKVEPIGRGEIMVIDSNAYYDLGISMLSKDPWYTAKGPPISIDEFIRKEMSF